MEINQKSQNMENQNLKLKTEEYLLSDQEKSVIENISICN